MNEGKAYKIYINPYSNADKALFKLEVDGVFNPPRGFVDLKLPGSIIIHLAPMTFKYIRLQFKSTDGTSIGAISYLTGEDLGK